MLPTWCLLKVIFLLLLWWFQSSVAGLFNCYDYALWPCTLCHWTQCYNAVLILIALTSVQQYICYASIYDCTLVSWNSMVYKILNWVEFWTLPHKEGGGGLVGCWIAWLLVVFIYGITVRAMASCSVWAWTSHGAAGRICQSTVTPAMYYTPVIIKECHQNGVCSDRT